jgi:hypothetical protein
VYSGRAVDEVLGRFAAHADFSRSEDGEYFVVEVSAANPAREREVVGELANHALGLTVERGGPDGDGAAGS